MLGSIKYFPFLFRHFCNISSFEKWSPERIERYQIKAFQKIFESACKIPFYKELYENAGVCDLKINSLEDLKRLPIIDKAYCRENGYEEFFLGKNIPSTMITPTSGSTGKPFHIRTPKRIEMIPPIKVIHAMRQFGWHPLMKGMEIWREDISTHKNFMRKSGLLKSVSIFKPLENIKQKIEKENPDFLYCNRTFYMELANYLEEKGIVYKPKYIICTAEEVSKEHRQRLESFFETKLINIFGCMEAPAIAYSCPDNDQLHVFQTTVVVELVNKRKIEGVEYGDMVITNLTNNVMPFIRYQTGDVVKITHEKCKCQRNSQIIGDILGRSDDVIKFRDGRIFNYIHIWQRFRIPILIENPKKIEQYKVWHQKKDDKLIFYFKLNQSLRFEEGAKLIEKILADNFSDVEYEYKLVDHIELSKSGKFKIIEIIE